MPVEPGNLDAVGESFRVGFPHFAPGTPEIRVDDHPANNVEAVKTGHRKVHREERVRAWDLSRVEMMTVLKILDDEKDEPEKDRSSHEHPVLPEIFCHQRIPGHDHRDARCDEHCRVDRRERDIEKMMRPFGGSDSQQDV